jgi:TRAP-type C4-dicarboxylate transport system permease small subunit
MAVNMSNLEKIVVSIDKVAAACCWVGKVIGCAGVFLMTLLITVDVAGRFLFGMPTYVATEFSGYLCVIITFIGLSYVSRIGRQIEVTILLDRFSKTVQQRLRLITTTVSLIFLIYFTYETAEVALLDFRFGARSLTFVHTPIWLISGCVPLGLSMLTIQIFSLWLKMVTIKAGVIIEQANQTIGEF